MQKKCAVLFTGGKDSCLALLLAMEKGYSISCLISIISENKHSYMFHTPSISQVVKQAEVMGMPIVIQKTKGRKEAELNDLKKAIKKAKDNFGINYIITGAVASVYQASRIKKICDELDINCFNPLWHRDQFKILKDLIKYKFEVVVTGVFAYPLGKDWLGRKIDRSFIKEMEKLHAKYKINPAGEGGEIETLVLFCPLFSRKLKIAECKISGEKNSYSMEVKLK